MAGQDFLGLDVEGVIRKVTDHVEQTQLSVVENSFSWKAARHEVDEWVWSSWMKFEDTCKGILVVLVDDVDLEAIQNQAPNTRK